MPTRVRHRATRIVLFAAALGVAAAALLRDHHGLVALARRGLAVPAALTADQGGCDDGEGHEGCDPGELDRPLQLPTGAPPALSCEDARQIVAQARASLAAAPPTLDAAKFAAATIDWLDPHGLWSVATDTPVGPAIRRRARELLDELGGPPGTQCRAAEEIGAELARWSGELRGIFDEALGHALTRHDGGDAWRTVSSTPFEDNPTWMARDLTRRLASDLATAKLAYGDGIAPLVDAARSRAAPTFDAAAWSHVLLAAAVRAYVPQLDAHGAWAPLDEELSIYDLALETAPPPRLWAEMTRTAVGVRIDRGAAPPLRDGDVVLEVHGVPLACVSVEQAEQLSVVADRPGAATRVSVLRAGFGAPTELVVVPALAGPATAETGGELLVDFVRYGDGRVAVVSLPDVPDDLGHRLTVALDHARDADIRGVLLDLRGNGGGSTDGAIAALGLFMPGVSLFPMRRRDGGIEIERAPDVPTERRWTGPLAALVDGDSASAAEMIAGAIASYRRGVVVGDRTYGKGCAQEYLDDDVHAGVLRLTTLLFALPDGAPVQKVGVAPDVRLSLPLVTEHESTTLRALGPWRGPDVRDAGRVREVPWPAHGGRVGPCDDPGQRGKADGPRAHLPGGEPRGRDDDRARGSSEPAPIDETVCRALRALGPSPAAAR